MTNAFDKWCFILIAFYYTQTMKIMINQQLYPQVADVPPKATLRFIYWPQPAIQFL